MEMVKIGRLLSEKSGKNFSPMAKNTFEWKYKVYSRYQYSSDHIWRSKSEAFALI
jgi:hypothetical protein